MENNKNLKERVTIYQVAQEAEVSLATVSRVINHQGNVTDATRMKVEETIKRLGYKPSGVAQALATNKSTSIGVVIPSANYVYISNLLAGINSVAKEKGLVLNLFTTGHSHDEAVSVINKVITTHVDGAIIFDDELDGEDIEQINSYSVPTVVLNKNIKGDRNASILFNYVELLRKNIVNYYEQGGSKLMSFVHVHNGGKLLKACEDEFVKIHEELGKEYDIINCDDSYTRTYEAFDEYFKSNQNIYFVAYRDSIAAAIENAATDNGLDVPSQVEVFSIVGTKYRNIIRPSLSSIVIDMRDVGTKAMNTLTDLINNELDERTYIFKGEIVKKDSTLY